MNERMTVAKYLATAMQEHGVSHIFELVGGMITVLLDSMHAEPDLRIISMHHEQAAGFAAEGFVRAARRPAVAMATSGPGATNLLTAIGSCYFDSTPVLFITGQVNRHEIREDPRIRQGGFQETDIVSMAKPVTKWAHRVDDPDAVPMVLAQAFHLLKSGRPGPVLLDLPMDVQQALIDPIAIGAPSPLAAIDPLEHALKRTGDVQRQRFIDHLYSALASARRPLILVGGGVSSAQVGDHVREIASWGLPVVTSLMGIDAIDAASPYRIGMIGSYGNRWANQAVAECDLLLVLGSRLDVRQTGSDIAGFRGNRQLFHVDVDDAELNSRVEGCVALHDRLQDFIPTLMETPHPPLDHGAWLGHLEALREQWPDEAENVPRFGPNPNSLMRTLSERWGDVTAWVTDVGQHQMWAAQSLRLRQGQRFLTSGGMGSMGFALPAAIGACLASDGPVALIAGDGGFQCNIQELQSAHRLGLPLRMVVLDNGSHGMVRQFQESYFQKRYYSTRWGYSAPDFSAVAEAYGITSYCVRDDSDLQGALDRIAESPERPVLLHVKIDPDLNAYPKLAFGRSFGSMEPQAKPVEMEGT